MILIILGVLMLIGLVIAHELGHFLAARRSGVEVEEFGIGFPPKAKSLGKKNGTEYTLNWLPLGGFVRLKGEHDADKSKGAYGAATLANKVKIMVAGVIVNAVIAVILMSVVAAVGLPQVLDDQFYVASDSTVIRHDVVLSVNGDNEENASSPASDAGLEDGDTLLSLQPSDCEDADCVTVINQKEDVRPATLQLANQDVLITYIDNTDEQQKTTVASFRSTQEVDESWRVADECEAQAGDDEDALNACPLPKGYLGVVPEDYVERQATWSAPIVGVVFSGQVVVETFATFGEVIGGLFRADADAARENLTGVVGIGYILGELADRGFISVLFLTGVISLSLAIMNILPIPALDGGRLFVTLLFRALRKPLTKDVEEKIHGSGFMLLMLLFLLITILDVQRFVFN